MYPALSPFSGSRRPEFLGFDLDTPGLTPIASTSVLDGIHGEYVDAVRNYPSSAVTHSGLDRSLPSKDVGGNLPTPPKISRARGHGQDRRVSFGPAGRLSFSAAEAADGLDSTLPEEDEEEESQPQKLQRRAPIRSSASRTPTSSGITSTTTPTAGGTRRKVGGMRSSSGVQRDIQRSGRDSAGEAATEDTSFQLSPPARKDRPPPSEVASAFAPNLRTRASTRKAKSAFGHGVATKLGTASAHKKAASGNVMRTKTSLRHDDVAHQNSAALNDVAVTATDEARGSGGDGDGLEAFALLTLFARALQLLHSYRLSECVTLLRKFPRQHLLSGWYATSSFPSRESPSYDA